MFKPLIQTYTAIVQIQILNMSKYYIYKHIMYSRNMFLTEINCSWFQNCHTSFTNQIIIQLVNFF
jgi:hypothetical protein